MRRQGVGEDAFDSGQLFDYRRKSRGRHTPTGCDTGVRWSDAQRRSRRAIWMSAHVATSSLALLQFRHCESLRACIDNLRELARNDAYACARVAEESRARGTVQLQHVRTHVKLALCRWERILLDAAPSARIAFTDTSTEEANA